MKDLQLDVQQIELRTLGDMAGAFSLHMECLTCGKVSATNLEKLIHRFGLDAPLRQVRLMARCSRCKRKQVRLLMRKKGIRGDRAWLPSPPHVGRH